MLPLKITSLTEDGSNEPVQESPPSPAFDALVTSRRAWLDDILRPWCLTADRRALRKAELDWMNLAGQVAPERSLWVWAWARFPVLINPELNAIEETYPVAVELENGRTVSGYPEARESEHGQLVLTYRDPVSRQFVFDGPFSIDDIRAITRLERLSF